MPTDYFEIFKTAIFPATFLPGISNRRREAISFIFGVIIFLLFFLDYETEKAVIYKIAKSQPSHGIPNSIPRKENKM